LDGLIEQQSGLIDLPLRVDLEDRPRQLVCYDYGKAAQTKWEVIAVEKGRSRVHFYPVTGRTHQLRVHSAHNWGLSTPILGDDLYGKKASRLHLHAETLEFEHPKTKEWLSFQVAADF
jgi:tRNA pseudouridine32 synthase/23S rRNA pseudouridine746 synthase